MIQQTNRIVFEWLIAFDELSMHERFFIYYNRSFTCKYVISYNKEVCKQDTTYRNIDV